MKLVLASYGSRGDIEPCVVSAVNCCAEGTKCAWPSPDLVGFAESAGLAAVAFGPDLQPVQDAWRKICIEANYFRNLRMREARGLITQCSERRARR